MRKRSDPHPRINHHHHRLPNNAGLKIPNAIEDPLFKIVCKWVMAYHCATPVYFCPAFPGVVTTIKHNRLLHSLRLYSIYQVMPTGTREPTNTRTHTHMIRIWWMGVRRGTCLNWHTLRLLSANASVMPSSVFPKRSSFINSKGDVARSVVNFEKLRLLNYTCH